jgi:hypothetical protein
MDGRLGDLEANPSPHFIPLISDNWSPHFRWRGAQDGPFPEAERAKLRLLVQRAHDQGRRLRLWNTPDSPVAWKELADAGLDLLNTDDLPGLAAFFRAKPGKK